MWLSRFLPKPKFEQFPKDSKWMLTENLKPRKNFLKKCKEFYDLKSVKQSKQWHREGNAWKHTMLTAGKMYELLHTTFNFDENDKRLMMVAALCHDLGKVPTTYFDEKEKDWKCKSHGAAGERITRNLLFNELSHYEREEICWLVRWHMNFHHLLIKPYEDQVNEIRRLSNGNSSIEKLLCLNIADSLASKSKNYSKKVIYAKYEKIKELAESQNCYRQPYKYPTAKKDNFNVYVMIGVPGSGKDTYISNFLKGKEVVSRDDIREEMIDGKVIGRKLYFDKIKEGQVTDIVNGRIKRYCETRTSFVINQTNMKKKYRDSIKEEILKYGNPKIVYVYIEPPSIESCKERRGHGKWDSIIDRMWGEFEFPDRTECDEFVFSKQINNQASLTYAT